MWRSLRYILAVIVLGGIGGGIVAASGLVTVAASSGHWLVTDWLLHSAMRRSVATQSAGLETPDLSDPGRVERAAGHYANNCMACHGAPGRDQAAIASAMTPPPPRLSEVVGEWEARELFWITRHGIKMTPMPAWPSQERPDEVWDMVAFLRELPEMTPAAYHRLAYGDTPAPAERAVFADGPAETTPADTTQAFAGGGEDGAPVRPTRQLVQACARCHGRDAEDGFAPDAFPPLEGQTETYLFNTLRAFKGGERQSGYMQAVAAEFTLQELGRLAAHYAERPAPDGGQGEQHSAELRAAGERIARQGLADSGVPACSSCHGPSPRRQIDAYPRLAPFSAGYIESQLHLLREGERGGTQYSPIMTFIARQLEDEDIAAVAAYYGGLRFERAQTGAAGSASD